MCELNELTGGGGETGLGGGGDKTGLGGGNKTGLGGSNRIGLGGGDEAGLGGGGEGEVTLVPAHMAHSVSPDSRHMNHIAVGSYACGANPCCMGRVLHAAATGVISPRAVGALFG